MPEELYDALSVTRFVAGQQIAPGFPMSTAGTLTHTQILHKWAKNLG